MHTSNGSWCYTEVVGLRGFAELGGRISEESLSVNLWVRNNVQYGNDPFLRPIKPEDSKRIWSFLLCVRLENLFAFGSLQRMVLLAFKAIVLWIALEESESLLDSSVFRLT